MALMHIRNRRSADMGTSLDALLGASGSDMSHIAVLCAEPVSMAPPNPSNRLQRSSSIRTNTQTDLMVRTCTSSVAPPSIETGETVESRPRASTPSRRSNRLSLTLPIAPPNSVPSRPIPLPGHLPPTPSDSVDTYDVHSPTGPDETIHAIATQERRVLELREELEAAEAELSRLKMRFKTFEAHKMRPSSVSSNPALSYSSPSARRSVDIDRKKALMLGQSTPREHKRTVIRGGHTRALSLLSPTKVSDDMSARERDGDSLRSPASDCHPFLHSSTDALSKRATWGPLQTSHPQAVKQIAQDFRQGLWTFVEDLRQATVGDEGISATSNRTCDIIPRLSRRNSAQDTIRASASNKDRGRIHFPDDALLDTPSKPPAAVRERAPNRMTNSKPDPKPRKHFSWTPLPVEDLGDDDWSNWDSPAGNKTARWSGTTVHGDIIPAIPEKADENRDENGNENRVEHSAEHGVENGDENGGSL